MMCERGSFKEVVLDEKRFNVEYVQGNSVSKVDPGIVNTSGY